jgi:UDP-N-acetylmuramate: L-alanyl-gamma-D-glutamyl-meso-diaminopimelate ligase
MRTKVDYSKVKKIHFLGIAGTGMAAVAGLCQSSGHEVCGSDGPIYPPMSTLLAELKIKVFPSYSAENLTVAKPDLVVVGNALSRGNVELEAVISSGIPYVSYPEVLGQKILSDRRPVVVSGTHGKTTTSTLMAFLLNELGTDPGYFIGGVPRNLPNSFALGKPPYFVLEGDEYDTAFFDKDSKFLHYRPHFLIINAIEFDHADIFASLEKIVEQFRKLIALVPDKKNIIANIDDPVIRNLLGELGISDKITSISPYESASGADVVITGYESVIDNSGQATTQVKLKTKFWGEFTLKSALTGRYNAANIAHAVGAVQTIAGADHWQKKPSTEDLAKIIAKFTGVRRRMDHLASVKGIDIFEDFAHHPTAVNHVIETLRGSAKGRRLLVAFEPRNATGRRNTFESEYAQVFKKADGVWIGECPVDKRIPEENRMNTGRLAGNIGPKAKAFQTNDELVSDLAAQANPGDLIVFMTSSSFSGCQHRIGEMLKNRFA